jgi:hypothetical protein
MLYVIRPALSPPLPSDPWDASSWRGADVLHIEQFRPESSDHRPITRAKLLYDSSHLYVSFHVQDRFVRCLHTDYQSLVFHDSCVEFFVQPKAGKGYFNFETNCGGAMLLFYIEDPARGPHFFRKYQPIPRELACSIQIHGSMPQKVDPEIAHPVQWQISYSIPLALLEHYVGPLGHLPGQTWRGNLYKCANHTSHPHWASWAPLPGDLNFHQPRYFAPIRFCPI